MIFFLLVLRFTPVLLLLIPLFSIYSSLHLQDTCWGMILGYQIITLPLVSLLSWRLMEEFPWSIQEAAVLDGATHTRFICSILLPVLCRGLLFTGVFAFLMGCHQLTIPLLLGGEKTAPYTLFLVAFLGHETPLGGVLAGAILFPSLPLLLIALLFQRELFFGFTLGAMRE